MKMQSFNWNKILGCVLISIFCAAIQVQAGGGGGGGGGRGGGGGGFGGFGGFGGGGAFGGGGGGARGASSTSSSEYNNNGTVGNAVFAIDPDTHNLIITADPVTMEQIREVISKLDAPEPQVFIKTVFLEVDDNAASAIGVQGSYTGQIPGFGVVTGFLTNSYSTGTVTTTGSGGTTVSTTLIPNVTAVKQSVNAGDNFGLPASLAGAAGSGGMYTVMSSDFTGTLQAIAAKGKAQVLSRPSILARDGQPAQIVVGQEVYLPSGVTYTTVGSSGSTVPNINGSYQNVGIILNVTPFIQNNNLVQMILQPQTSQLDTSTPGQVIAYGSSILNSSPVYAPNIDIRSANTVVVTPSGQTVVIGGLIGNTKAVNVTKVPFLGDIPLIGNLFKLTTKSAQKQELLIFVTPHIVEAPSKLAMMSSTETQGSEMMTNSSISEQELDQYLDRLPVKKN
jgi:general secretion pathway protein D